ncbi:hypothetical protein BaRGS_00015285 [Batillaria attramentaria]|uniref:Seipin n=1 Tax=Batillaria attramentaria TaxID=370345 RepID=A0ABD0L1P7_9CAEN
MMCYIYILGFRVGVGFPHTCRNCFFFSSLQVLGRGQRYNMLLEMEVPDSAGNRDLGMFMVVIKVYDRHGHIVQESSRSKQNLKIDLFEDYLDDVYHPAVGVLIEIHSRQLEIYTAQLKLHATYTGIRYYMFYWPLTSAFFGIGFNCMWLTLIALLSWYKLGAHVSPDTQENTEKKQLTFQQREERVKTLIDEDNQAGGQQAETGFRYIQPFTMTTSYREAETIGEARPEAGGEHQRGSSSSRGQQDASSLLRQRGRTETPS